MLTENVIEVEKHVQAACDRAGRSRDEVTLIAVSKTKPVSDIEEVLTTGILDYGENKVQELSDKYEVLPKNIRWHMIGHLQRNKVKYLMPVLIEVNVAEEESKFGTTSEAAMQLVEAVSKMPHIKIRGLMTIAPFTDNPEDNRIYFRKLKQLSVDIKSKNIDNVDMDELSMGMTGDYEVAIEEGATMVRVGTGIFGKRNYQI